MKVGEVFGYKPEKRTFMGDEAFVLPTCLMGIEVELENFVEGVKIPDFWITSDDPSLRNNGIELKLEVPLCGVDLKTALYDLDTTFQNRKVESPLYRTSDHLHLDVRDMTMDELRSLILTFIVVERVLIQNVAPERGEHHIFSLPFYKATGDQPLLADLFSDQKQRIYEAARKANKYSALNIKPLFNARIPRPREQEEPLLVQRAAPDAPVGGKHGAVGSVEFRFFPSSTDCDLIMHWINLVQCIKRYAVQNAQCPVADFPKQISKIGVKEFFFQVFGAVNPRCLMYQGYEADLLEGVRSAQDIIYNLRDPEMWTEDVLLPKCRDSRKGKATQPFTRYRRKHQKKEVV